MEVLANHVDKKKLSLGARIISTYFSSNNFSTTNNQRHERGLSLPATHNSKVLELASICVCSNFFFFFLPNHVLY